LGDSDCDGRDTAEVQRQRGDGPEKRESVWVQTEVGWATLLQSVFTALPISAEHRHKLKSFLNDGIFKYSKSHEKCNVMKMTSILYPQER
jgi:hypothetical protein